MPTAQLQGTLTNYITRVRRYLRETTAAKSHWSDDFLKQLFNVNYRRRCGQLIGAYEGFFTIVATRDLVAEQEKYAWPSGFNRLQKLELVRTDGRTVPIQRDERHVGIKTAAVDSGDLYYPTYRMIGNGLVLEPAPLETVTGGLRMEYTGTPNELQSDGDSLHPDFPAIFDELLVLDTAVSAIDQESTQAIGQGNNLRVMRMEWEVDFDNFVNNRAISTQHVTPFITHYLDY